MIRLNIRTRSDWRKWLEKNCLKESKVEVVVYKKHTGKPFLSHREFLEEAICFGWIDTTIKRLDEDTFLRKFVRRNDKSKWSKNTLKYAEELLRKGIMHSEGIRRYKEGLSRPVHDAGIPRNPEMPEELRKAIKGKAKNAVNNLPPSMKKMMFKMILRAKLPATKEKRVQWVINTALMRS